ncbi:hypothetical protein [Treponema ruminis]|uniref:Uncharacterized protein n=1 Tax=Treponema ruminis TaxID=744515 RepID=A0A7W8LMK0_9SPIR|nr:hypothetical protein [Treponema ruminis]MBB5226562.1 hypothetical protein [Treponema ruminis]
MFEDIASFLSERHLELRIFIDDAVGTLTIYFKDGHKEEYDRGMGYEGDYLSRYIKDLF